MEAYYHNQATMPHFSGNYRQRGSGFGALAVGIGRVALPFARKFIVPAAERIGKELLVQHNQKTSWSWTQSVPYEQKTEDSNNNNDKKKKNKSSHSKETNSTEKSLQLFYQSTK